MMVAVSVFLFEKPWKPIIPHYSHIVALYSLFLSPHHDLLYTIVYFVNLGDPFKGNNIIFIVFGDLQ